MTLTLTPQELRDLLDGASEQSRLRAKETRTAAKQKRLRRVNSPSIMPGIVAPANPPDGEYNGLRPPDPPVDMSPRVSCAPRGQD